MLIFKLMLQRNLNYLKINYSVSFIMNIIFDLNIIDYYDKAFQINPNLAELLTEKELTVFSKVMNNE
jgi:hypothetical protein